MNIIALCLWACVCLIFLAYGHIEDGFDIFYLSKRFRGSEAMRVPFGIGKVQRSLKVRGRKVFTILRLGLVQGMFGDLGVSKAVSHILSAIIILHLPRV